MSTLEPQPDDSGALPVQGATAKTRAALSRLKRELNEEELSTPGVQKMLIAEVERLDSENGELACFRDKFYTAERAGAVLTQKLNEKRAAEIISTACTVLAGAAFGYVPAVWSQETATAAVAIVVGVVLLGAGIAARVIRQ